MRFCLILLAVLMVQSAYARKLEPAAPADDNYVLVFSDEFNGRSGSQPDTTKWVRCQRGPSTWNRWISSSDKVVYIKNGTLVCRAIPNKKELADTAKMLTGAVETLGKFAFQYGKVEVRMKTNLKQGNFPAVWLKPVPGNNDTRYGEMDVVEMFGYLNKSHHTTHTHQTHILKKSEAKQFTADVDVRKWHVYGMEWKRDRIVYTVDGKVVGIYRKSNNAEELADGQWTFDRPFYLRLNQSVGDGSFPRFTPQLNQKYETRFDWIRVYKER